jgi:hypothetical protein
MAEETEVQEEKKETKSIVPAKYAGRYKNGGTDALAVFINEQCRTAEGFDYAKFFDLCRKNGIAEEQVSKYEGQVNEGRHGSQGRARMTLRNMLATIGRKDGKLVNLEGNEVEVAVPAATLSGAAKTAQEKTATSGAEASTY